MNDEKKLPKTKKGTFSKFVIVFLCIVLVLSWCYTFFNSYMLKESFRPHTVKGNTAKKIERLSSDFMSYLCDLDFSNASECLDHLDMAGNLNSELTKKAINNFADSFLYKTNFKCIYNPVCVCLYNTDRYRIYNGKQEKMGAPREKVRDWGSHTPKLLPRTNHVDRVTRVP